MNLDGNLKKDGKKCEERVDTAAEQMNLEVQEEIRKNESKMEEGSEEETQKKDTEEGSQQD